MNQRSFEGLGVSEPLCRALCAEGYTHPTPIQAQAVPLLLAGKDLLGIAQTGTGKTAAFALPILQHLAARPGESGRNGNSVRPHANGRRGGRNRRSSAPRALILAPTRELALQIGESLRAYGRHLPLRHTVILGGVSQRPQVNALVRGVDILVATPGRLLDLHEQGHVRLHGITHLVLDEADLMLDMGFLRDVRKIVAAVPQKRQTILCSATMPPDVERLSAEVLRDPARVEVSSRTVTVEQVDQRVFFVEAANKRALLSHLLQDEGMRRVIVFTRTKRGASRLADQLGRAGFSAEAIHGNKTQSARQSALRQFQSGRARVLVATDVAARGIDIAGVSHVVNYEMPNVPESYVHRVGRTARAGAEGIALSFCDASERAFLRGIERLTKQPIAVHSHPHEGEAPERRSQSQRPAQSKTAKRSASNVAAPKRQGSPKRSSSAPAGAKPRRRRRVRTRTWV